MPATLCADSRCDHGREPFRRASAGDGPASSARLAVPREVERRVFASGSSADERIPVGGCPRRGSRRRASGDRHHRRRARPGCAPSDTASGMEHVAPRSGARKRPSWRCPPQLTSGVERRLRVDGEATKSAAAGIPFVSPCTRLEGRPGSRGVTQPTTISRLDSWSGGERLPNDPSADDGCARLQDDLASRHSLRDPA
jgi:hypothetical protein